jgi:hypothetical protein
MPCGKPRGDGYSWLRNERLHENTSSSLAQVTAMGRELREKASHASDEESRRSEQRAEDVRMIRHLQAEIEKLRQVRRQAMRSNIVLWLLHGLCLHFAYRSRVCIDHCLSC